jgi:membrane-associated protease RseP (regulator of RpoE activity)
MKRQEHVYRIAYPLLAEAAVLNPDEAELTCGLLVHNIESYREDFREAAGQYYNLDKQIAVRFVHPQFPAACAGVCNGDKIVSINGKAIAGTTQEDLKKVVAELKPAGGKPLDMAVSRNGEVTQLSIEGKSYCPYPVLLFTGDKINAFSDGKYIILTTGIYRMAQTDEERWFYLMKLRITS